MKTPLRVLMIEDREDDALLVVRELERGGYAVASRRVDAPDGLADALEEVPPWDLVITDWSMPQFGALEALDMLNERSLDIPIVVVSGTIGEETAVAALRGGAGDFILKDRLARLNPAVERGLRDARSRRALRATEERYRRIVETTSEGVWIIDANGDTDFMNARMATMMGVRAEETIGKPAIDLVHLDSRSTWNAHCERRERGVVAHADIRLARSDGKAIWCSSTPPSRSASSAATKVSS